jgi:hypothetical protein
MVLLTNGSDVAPNGVWYLLCTIPLGIFIVLVYYIVHTNKTPSSAFVNNKTIKILYTSVLINTCFIEYIRKGFLEGEIVIPSFVVREAQPKKMTSPLVRLDIKVKVRFLISHH